MRGIARLASRYSSADSPPRVRGSTDKAAQRAMKPRAHPRWCGEHFIEQAHCADIPAHPRVCGEIATCIGSRLIGPGPTPACAGKTTLDSIPDARDRAHPRWCGEYLFQSQNSLRITGPPPRVRGMPCTPRGPWRFWAHPRSCRERGCKAVNHQNSAPRVCGEYRGGVAVFLRRFGATPARAGNTLM